MANRVIGLGAAILYLTHPAILGANFYDMHELAFAPALFLSAYYCWLKRFTVCMWLFTALLLMVKEDLSIIVALFGIHSILFKRVRDGVWLLVAGVCSYLILQHGVIPYFADQSSSYAYYFSNLVATGEGPTGVVISMIDNPLGVLRECVTYKKMLFLVQVCAPFAFLGFFYLRAYPLCMYGLLLALLADRPALFELGFHYVFHLIPYFMLACAHALRDTTLFQATRMKAKALLLCGLLALLTNYHYGLLIQRENFKGGFRMVDFSFSERDEQRYEDLKRLITQLPPDASIIASENIVPHLARRRHVRSIDRSAGDVHNVPQYILVSLREAHEPKVKNLLRNSGVSYKELKTTPFFQLYEQSG